MSYLKEKLGEVDRQAVIADTVRLIDDEVGRKSGLSGAALKAGYKAVKKLKGGRMIDKAVDMLLDDFTEALSPLHDDFRAQDEIAGFDSYLKRHGGAASDALLAITDGKVERADNRLIRSTYKRLRGQAEKHVIEALPGVGRMIDRHVPPATT